jgi:hypothetical protein
MTIDDLKKSIQDDTNTIDDYNREQCENIPSREKWLKTAITLQDNEVIHSILNSPVKKSKYVHWTDRITCSTCGVEYSRSNQSGHRKTKVHTAYAEMNDKIRDLLVSKVGKK